MAKVSREAARSFSRLPRCRIPRNFYHDLLTTTLSPDIFQVFSLSAISGYGLTDWLALFGCAVECRSSLACGCNLSAGSLVARNGYSSCTF